ncbi:basic-leucine zipper (bZIP) transcription factor [Pochonia chlamydosporia 170]|uniref:Putative transcription factor kapC n=1 Tax=Pochonia chlamydosporia 170 TaxID=1380566 RepID=A0A179F9U3_METCM|nr:basic-leucine zipper (bZIP) transcription factor [Pochonia chlamydosporia 170]OAQ62100.1 basic-leucine zipper (bZIP) transcription factor [Pochonia chlamydosporia 170]
MNPTSSAEESQSQTTSSIPAPWLDFLNSMPLPHSQIPSTSQTYAYTPQPTFPNVSEPSYTSPTSTASEPSVPSQPQPQDQKPPRKRENRYRNAPPSVLSRRRAQNRASQRAYRERKEQRIKDLEQLLQEANQREENLTQAYLSLQAEYQRLRAEPHDSSMGSASAVGSEVPAEYDSSLMQQGNMMGGFDFSPNMYQYDDSDPHNQQR